MAAAAARAASRGRKRHAALRPTQTLRPPHVRPARGCASWQDAFTTFSDGVVAEKALEGSRGHRGLDALGAYLLLLAGGADHRKAAAGLQALAAHSGGALDGEQGALHSGGHCVNGEVSRGWRRWMLGGGSGWSDVVGAEEGLSHAAPARWHSSEFSLRELSGTASSFPYIHLRAC